MSNSYLILARLFCPWDFLGKNIGVGYHFLLIEVLMGFPGGSDSKASACSAGDPGSISGLGRSPGEGNGNPLQYSCLGNPMDRGAWWATIYRVSKELDRT